MYRVSELAEKVGLSRSALLYYEKLGLLHGIRQTNGYRLYSDKDVQQVHLLKQLQAGGLTLKECRSFLDGELPRSVLERRLQQVNKEIAEKRLASELLSALLGQGSLRDWHKQTDKLAPDALRDWLKRRGFSEQQTLNLKWLSKDMNEHEQYMADFMAVFAELDRWGPGSDADTLRALSAAPNTPKSIVDIGCGKGFSTRLLVEHTQAHIVALDNEQLALDDLGNHLASHALNNRVTLSCASMTKMPFTHGSFDLIWAEASAYIMGVEQALEQWRPYLSDEGHLVISDLVWLSKNPSPAAEAFWAGEYADMQCVDLRLGQMQQAGFAIVDHFTLSEQAWSNYYHPLKLRVTSLKRSMPDSLAITDIEREIDVYERFLGEFGYQFFILRRT